MPYYLKKTRRIVYRRRYRRYGGYRSKRTAASYAARKTYSKLLYNPFARTNTNPKISDGREFLSSGIRLQAVKELICGSDPNPTLIAVFPGLSNGIWVITPGGGAAVQPISMPYNNHCQGTGATQDPATKIAKWRMVSQGVRFQLLNNSDENEGWFEMIRYQVYPGTSSGFQITPQNSIIELVGNAADAVPGYDAASTVNMCEHPTYTTGKLRHLNRMVFKLYANTGDHEFLNVENTITDPKQMLDTSFDCLLFKIHGRTVNAGEPTAQPTKLLCHIASNQEVVYDESSSLARYMTPNATRRGVNKQVGNGYLPNN